MARVNENIKTSLREAGLWKMFYQRRDELRAGGMSATEAYRLSLGEVLPGMESAGWRAVFGEDGEIADFARPAGSGGVAETAGKTVSVVTAERSERKSETVVSSKRRSKATEWMGGREVFEGKTATVVENIQWVAENLENPDPRPEDAPSAVAWGMLVHYQFSPATKADFWNGVYVKLVPSKAQLPTAEVVVMDGEATVALFERMLARKREAEEDA